MPNSISEYYKCFRKDLVTGRLNELRSTKDNDFREEEEFAVLSYIDYSLKVLRSKKKEEEISEILGLCLKYDIVPNYDVSGPIVFNAGKVSIGADGKILACQSSLKEGSAILLVHAGSMMGFCLIPVRGEILNFSFSESANYLAVACSYDKENILVIWSLLELKVVFYSRLGSCTSIDWMDHIVFFVDSDNVLVEYDLCSEECSEYALPSKIVNFRHNPNCRSVMGIGTNSFILPMDGEPRFLNCSFSNDSVIHPTAGGFNVLSGTSFYVLSDTVNDVKSLGTDIRTKTTLSDSWTGLCDPYYNRFPLRPAVHSSQSYLVLGNKSGKIQVIDSGTGSKCNRYLHSLSMFLDEIRKKYDYYLDASLFEYLHRFGQVWYTRYGHVIFTKLLETKNGIDHLESHWFPFEHDYFGSYRENRVIKPGVLDLPLTEGVKQDITLSNEFRYARELRIMEGTSVDPLPLIDYTEVKESSCLYLESSEHRLLLYRIRSTIVCITEKFEVKYLPKDIELVEKYLSPSSIVVHGDNGWAILGADMSMTILPSGEENLLKIYGKSALYHMGENVFQAYCRGEAFENRLPFDSLDDVGFIDENTVCSLTDDSKFNNYGRTIHRRTLNVWNTKEGTSSIQTIPIGDYVVLNYCRGVVTLAHLSGERNSVSISLSSINMDTGEVRDWADTRLPVNYDLSFDYERLSNMDAILSGKNRYAVVLEDHRSVIRKYEVKKDGLIMSGNALALDPYKVNPVLTVLSDTEYLFSSTVVDEDHSDVTRNDMKDPNSPLVPVRSSHRMMDSLTGKTVVGEDGDRYILQGLPQCSVGYSCRVKFMRNGDILVFQHSSGQLCSWNLKTKKRYPEGNKQIFGYILGKLNEGALLVAEETEFTKFSYKLLTPELKKLELPSSPIADVHSNLDRDIYSLMDRFEIEGKSIEKGNVCFKNHFGMSVSLGFDETLVVYPNGIIPSNDGRVEAWVCHMVCGFAKITVKVRVDAPLPESDTDTQVFIDNKVNVCSSDRLDVLTIVDDVDAFPEEWNIEVLVFEKGKEIARYTVQSPFFMDDLGSVACVRGDLYAFINGKDNLVLELHDRTSVIRSIPLPKEVYGVVPKYADKDKVLLVSTRDGALYYSDWNVFEKLNSDINVRPNSVRPWKLVKDNPRSIVISDGLHSFKVIKDPLTIEFYNENNEREIELNTGTLVSRFGICVLRRSVDDAS